MSDLAVTIFLVFIVAPFIACGILGLLALATEEERTVIIGE